MKNEVIKSGIVGGLTTATSVAFSNHPEIVVIVSTGLPAFVETVGEYCTRMLSKIQSTRLAGAISYINKEFDRRLTNGEQIRQDDFMTANNGDAVKQVMEGILRSIEDEFENKKVEYHNNFFVNLCFDERIIFNQAITVSRIIKNLSYRQLVIVAYVRNVKQLKTGGWEARFKDYKALADFWDLYSEILDLYHSGILVQDCIGHMLGGAPFRLSELGNILYDEASLDRIPQEDTEEVDNSITKINNIINSK